MIVLQDPPVHLEGPHGHSRAVEGCFPLHVAFTCTAQGSGLHSVTPPIVDALSARLTRSYYLDHLTVRIHFIDGF